MTCWREGGRREGQKGGRERSGVREGCQVNQTTKNESECRKQQLGGDAVRAHTQARQQTAHLEKAEFPRCLQKREMTWMNPGLGLWIFTLRTQGSYGVSLAN